jgi:hypothetical protein
MSSEYRGIALLKRGVKTAEKNDKLSYNVLFLSLTTELDWGTALFATAFLSILINPFSYIFTVEG